MSTIDQLHSSKLNWLFCHWYFISTTFYYGWKITKI